jgi:hypothetical protein
MEAEQPESGGFRRFTPTALIRVGPERAPFPALWRSSEPDSSQTLRMCLIELRRSVSGLGCLVERVTNVVLTRANRCDRLH